MLLNKVMSNIIFGNMIDFRRKNNEQSEKYRAYFGKNCKS